ncbi:MAG: MauE/DoxX family redox-associated membrane protein [Desulfobaccales bacterium]
MQITKNLIARRALEIILGGLFFYAGLQKLLHPYEFAEAVLAYQLVPETLVGVVVAVLPWVEIAAGLCLAAGVKRRSCLLILSGLLAAFLVVILVTLARGLKIDCGCGLFFQRQVGLVAIAEDLFLLAWAAGLYQWERLTAGHNSLGFSPKTEN